MCALMILMSTSLSGGTITGKVTDRQTGEALAGVNVLIEGTKLGASTDASGEYLIKDVPRGRYTLRTGYIGYCSQTKRIRLFLNQSTLTENFELDFPSIPVVESDSVEAYQNEIYRIRDPISIKVDTLMLINNQVEVKVSVKNKTQYDLYILRSVRGFDPFSITIHNQAGKRAEPRLINLGSDVMPLPLPQPSDLFKIKARQTVQYPDPIASDGILNYLGSGRYTVRVDYSYKLIKAVGPAYIGCATTADDIRDEIDVLTKILRGHFVSDNNVFFDLD